MRFELIAFEGKRSERAIRLRDGQLGGAQRVARLAPLGPLFIELALQLADVRAQLGEIALARRRRRGERRKGEHERAERRQTLALPCADTAPMRRSISAASPR